MTENATANSGAPSVLVAYGVGAADRLRRAPLAGTFVPLPNPTPRRDPMSTDTPRPERVTLTDEERELSQQHTPHRWFREDAVETILAAREQALRDKIAGEIEDLPDVDGLWDLISRGHAARIARGGAR